MSCDLDVLSCDLAVLSCDLQLSEVQGYVQTWREKVMGVARTLELREANMNIRVGTHTHTHTHFVYMYIHVLIHIRTSQAVLVSTMYIVHVLYVAAVS